MGQRSPFKKENDGMKLSKTFKNMPVRYKLLVTYPVLFVLATAVSGVIVYSIIKAEIQASIESELGNSTAATLAVFKTSVAVSIQNYLRAIAEKNRDVVNEFYEDFRNGRLTESQAMFDAERVLKSQVIGDTGYIYCLDSRGVVAVHKQSALLNKDVAGHSFVKEQIGRKVGYIEYNWQNPDEKTPRPKALYMTYFEPWDWIISVSSYRDEFISLLNTKDFNETVVSLRFGETGYSFVVNGRGEILMHPKMNSKNHVDMANENASQFIKRISDMRSGKINYMWKNPGEAFPREKMAVFDYIPELDWIVVSSGYMDEFYGPLRTVRNTILVTLAGALILVLPLTTRISSYITNPLNELMHKFAAGRCGDFSVRVKSDSEDELGKLGSYFNAFMERFEEYSRSLQAQILERRVAEEALRSSEEKFSKAFKSSPNGVCLITLKDMVIMEVNESLVDITGYSNKQLIGRSASQIGVFPRQQDMKQFADMLNREGRIRNREIELITKDNRSRKGLMCCELFELRGDPVMLVTIQDITESRSLERELMEIADRERKRIGQDLHDDLGPHLIGIEVLSKVLQRKLSAKHIDEASHVERIRNLIQEATDKTKTFARGLCPVNLEADGLRTALCELARKTEDFYGVLCKLKCPASVLIYDNTVATHLFYITQEAVNNAVRHGRARNIEIELVAEGSRLTLKITDDGVGMASITHEGGMGLRTMDFRARVIGKSMRVYRSPSGGTTVECVPTPQL